MAGETGLATGTIRNRLGQIKRKYAMTLGASLGKAEKGSSVPPTPTTPMPAKVVKPRARKARAGDGPKAVTVGVKRGRRKKAETEMADKEDDEMKEADGSADGAEPKEDTDDSMEDTIVVGGPVAENGIF